jgi:hypothetical protein
VVVAQLAERLVVVQVVVGSSPIIHPIGAWRSPASAPALGAGSRKFKSFRPDKFFLIEKWKYLLFLFFNIYFDAPVAQLDRATVF